MRKSFIAIAALFFLTVEPALARVQTGQISQLIVRNSDGLMYFFLNATPPSLPACAAQPYLMIRDENSATGKRQLALLMLARSTGQTITVIGTDRCERWYNGEDVDGVSF